MIGITDEMMTTARDAMLGEALIDPSCACELCTATLRKAFAALAPLIEAQVREQCAKALQPFASVAEYMEVDTEGFDDRDELHLVVPPDFVLYTSLTVGDFRRALIKVLALSNMRPASGPTEPETGFAK